MTQPLVYVSSPNVSSRQSKTTNKPRRRRRPNKKKGNKSIHSDITMDNNDSNVHSTQTTRTRRKPKQPTKCKLRVQKSKEMEMSGEENELNNNDNHDDNDMPMADLQYNDSETQSEDGNKENGLNPIKIVSKLRKVHSQACDEENANRNVGFDINAIPPQITKKTAKQNERSELEEKEKEKEKEGSDLQIDKENISPNPNPSISRNIIKKIKKKPKAKANRVSLMDKDEDDDDDDDDEKEKKQSKTIKKPKRRYLGFSPKPLSPKRFARFGRGKTVFITKGNEDIQGWIVDISLHKILIRYRGDSDTKFTQKWYNKSSKRIFQKNRRNQ